VPTLWAKTVPIDDVETQSRKTVPNVKDKQKVYTEELGGGE